MLNSELNLKPIIHTTVNVYPKSKPTGAFCSYVFISTYSCRSYYVQEALLSRFLCQVSLTLILDRYGFNNDYMKPSKLREHLHNVHLGNVEDTGTSFETKRARFEERSTLDVHGFVEERNHWLIQVTM